MPYVGNKSTTFNTFSATDVSVTDDLTVTDDASVGGDLAITGATTVTGNVGIGITPTVKLDVLLDTDKRIAFSGGIGEIGSTAGFQTINSAGSALTGFGIRASDIKFATGSAARLNINSDGDIDVETGAIFFSTAGKGIVLGATSNTAANTLDDYEEGTHNPTDSSGASLTFSTFTGAYTKIGNVVCFQAKVIYPSTSNSSEARISLPFVVGAPHANYYPSGKNDANGNTSASLTLGVTGQSYAIFKNDSGGSTATNANLSGANINIALTYKTT